MLFQSHCKFSVQINSPPRLLSFKKMKEQWKLSSLLFLRVYFFPVTTSLVMQWRKWNKRKLLASKWKHQWWKTESRKKINGNDGYTLHIFVNGCCLLFTNELRFWCLNLVSSWYFIGNIVVLNNSLNRFKLALNYKRDFDLLGFLFLTEISS